MTHPAEFYIWFADMDAVRLLHHRLGQPDLQDKIERAMWEVRIDKMAAELAESSEEAAV